MVTKEKLLYEQAYHALLGGIIGSRFTHPFKEICSTIGLTEKEWNKRKKFWSSSESRKNLYCRF